MISYHAKTKLGRAVERGEEYPGANGDVARAVDELVEAAERVVDLLGDHWQATSAADAALSSLRVALSKSRKA